MAKSTTRQSTRFARSPSRSSTAVTLEASAGRGIQLQGDARVRPRLYADAGDSAGAPIRRTGNLATVVARDRQTVGQDLQGALQWTSSSSPPPSSPASC